MSLPEPSYVAYKYDHGGEGMPVLKGLGLVAGIFLVTGLAVWAVGGVGMTAFIACIALLVVKWPHKRLLVGLRYLVSGKTIAYYRNVQKMTLRPGTLTLHCADKQSFHLQEDKFPTNARKDAKVKANKKAKFDKVSRKIIERVLAASPGVETSGIDKMAYTRTTE